MKYYNMMIKDLLLYFALLLWFVVPLQAQPTIFAEDLEGKPGDEVEVLFRVDNFVDVVAWQFTFEWDSDVLQYVDFGQFNLVELDRRNFGPDSLSVDNFILSTWFEGTLAPISFPEDEVVFSIRFNVIGEATDSTRLWFSGNELANIVNVNGTSMEFQSKEAMFRVMETTSSTQAVPDNFNLTVSPNPFSENAQVSFNLEESYKDLNIAIYTLDGKQVYQETNDFPAGQQSINIDAEVLPTNGIYLLNLTSNNLHTTHKLIFENY